MLKVIKVNIELKPVEPIELPVYKGSTFRGDWARYLKRWSVSGGTGSAVGVP